MEDSVGLPVQPNPERLGAVSLDQERFNAAEYFIDRNVREGRGDKIAVCCEDRSVTYAQLQTRVNQFGNVLRDRLDTRIEERVALLLLDTEIFPQAFFGAIKMGAVPVCLNTLMRPKDYRYFLNDSRARVLVVDAELLECIEEIRPELEFLQHIVVANGESDVPGDKHWDALLSHGSTELTAAPTTADDACFWLYSSGSTGQPKGTVHLQHDMVHAAESFGKGILGIRADDVCLSAPKLFFAYGLGNNLYFPFSVGATAVYHPGRPTPEAVYANVERHKPTIFYGVPTLYGQMLAHTSGGMQGVRMCVSAGEALPPDIFKRWRERFDLEIVDAIGSTEMSHCFISNTPGACRPGCTGKIVPGYEGRIVDENLVDVPPGEVGTLLIRGDSAAAYYWNKHEKTKQTMLGEWLNTGDKFFQDEEGNFFYAGRTDDMMKIGGIWVSPVEVEAAVIEHPAVLECAVIPAEDGTELIKPKVYVVLNRGETPGDELAQSIKDHVKQVLAHYKYPRWVEFVDELPKTPTGKIKRFELRKRNKQ